MDKDQALQRAEGYKLAADSLCHIRAKSAPFVGAAIALTQPNWVTTATAAGLMATDGLDGPCARNSARILRNANLPVPENALEDGGMLDQQADKKFLYGLFAGQLARSALSKDWKALAFSSAITAANLWRDHRMQQDRERAQAHDISTNAIVINKAKTGLHFLGMTALISPLSENKLVRRAAVATITIGTATGIIGERQYRAQVNQAIAEQSADNERPSPRTATFPRVIRDRD